MLKFPESNYIAQVIHNFTESHEFPDNRYK